MNKRNDFMSEVDAIPAKPKRVWTSQQEAVFDNIVNGKGHTMVVARAGTGKTTTIREAVRRLPDCGGALLTAFNKHAALALQKELPSGADARTLHSLGLLALKQQGNGASITVDNDKGERIAEKIAGGQHRGVVSAIRRGAKLAKAQLAQNLDQVATVLDHFDIDAAGVLDEDLSKMVGQALADAMKDRATVDFDDMVWLPLSGEPPEAGYTHIFVDEAQDMDPAQLSLARMFVGDDTRLCFIGDPAQAIYSWKGADGDFMSKMSGELGMHELPLTVSYRCARRIVERAKLYVPDFEAAPNAEQGLVQETTVGYLRSNVRPGDFVLSRTNAPLVPILLGFIREGKRATIQGRSMGERIKRVVTKLAKQSNDVDAMLEAAAAWKEIEVERRKKRDRPSAHIVDLFECIRAFSEGTNTVEQVIGRIGMAFDDGGEDTMIVLSTTHRAKGLERDRVFMLGETYLRKRPVEWNSMGKPIRWDIPQEEKNLAYVAMTRAKRELYIARDTHI